MAKAKKARAKAAAPSAPSPAAPEPPLETLRAVLTEAASGKFPAAMELVRAAGFVLASEAFRVRGHGAVAEFFGCSERAIRGYGAEGMPGAAVGKGKVASVDLREAARWLFERHRKDQQLFVAGGGNSPALEKYRQARAEEARLDLLERQGELLGRQQVESAMSTGASVFVGGITQLRERLSRIAPAAADEIAAELDATAAKVREALQAYAGHEEKDTGDADAAA